MTRQEIEAALDASLPEVQTTTGSWLRARRSGRTQTWRSRPTHFRLPIKFGFRGTGAITHLDESLAFTGFRILPQPTV